MRRDILVLLTDLWADWEASYAISLLNQFSEYEVKTVSIDKIPKASMGGVRAEIDYDINEYDNFENTKLIIIPGGLTWEENPYVELSDFVKKAKNSGVIIAGICGATKFLGRHGILDDVKHTSDALEVLTVYDGYKGEENFELAQIVSDKGIITANETAALDFALEIFKAVGFSSEEDLKDWYDNFKNGYVR